MTVRTLRTEKLDLRVSSSAKRMLEAAASVSNRSLSAFVLESALARADEALADRRAFPLSRAKWNDFLAALDAPPALSLECSISLRSQAFLTPHRGPTPKQNVEKTYRETSTASHR